MIYILVGGDTKNKSLFIKELTKTRESFFLRGDEVNKDQILSYGYNVNLFNKSPVVVLENALSGAMSFSVEELNGIKKSETIFVFSEDKLLKVVSDKYKKYGEIKIFEDKNIILKEKFNVFGITDSFAKRDKVGTWVLYNKSLEEGVEPEAIAGVLFWKIKSMILSSSNVFTKNELKQQSSNIISLYHKAHKGEEEMTISLEQFILNSLSSK